ncbi:hypothetical protein CCH79_00019591 [Gambusia affinis]|uniref:Receptor-type tyrosine-protein phosphatase U-like Fn3 domain-containing protein n=1 Tax=Gambusia affinis TaxID=33528 RepID=A0A315UX77_GAMAF|nr:hypothetical protein CCH79_00019591 [Gambusia affinis]
MSLAPPLEGSRAGISFLSTMSLCARRSGSSSWPPSISCPAGNVTMLQSSTLRGSNVVMHEHSHCSQHPSGHGRSGAERGAFMGSQCCERGAKYQVVVEEERPRRLKRGTAEILRCYPVPIHFQNASLLNSQYYFSAELPMADLRSPTPFCIVTCSNSLYQVNSVWVGLVNPLPVCWTGDNRTYGGYWNAPLLPHKSYGVYYQAVSSANGVSPPHWCPSNLTLGGMQTSLWSAERGQRSGFPIMQRLHIHFLFLLPEPGTQSSVGIVVNEGLANH